MKDQKKRMRIKSEICGRRKQKELDDFETMKTMFQGRWKDELSH